MALSDDEIQRLLDRLISATRNGRVKWVEGSTDFDFSAELAGSDLFIASIDDDDAHPFRFVLVKDDLELADVESTISEGIVKLDRVTLQLETLYRLAKRQALQIEDAIAELFAELDKVDPQT